jgi:membrane protease YdiL (CAAX protease family)
METPTPHSPFDPAPPESPAPEAGLWTTWPRRHVLGLTVLLMVSNVMVQMLVFSMGLGLFPSVLAGAVVGVLLPLTVIARPNPRRMMADLGLDRPHPMILLAAAVLMLCSLLPTSRLAELSMRLHPPSPGWEGFMLEHMPVTPWQTILAGLTVILAAPLVEEIIFRGLLQNLTARLWGAIPGLVIAALVFALVHNEAWFLFGLIGVGLVLGFVFQATGSVTAAWVAHAVHNAVSLGMMVNAGDAAAEPAPFTIQDAGWLLLSIAGLFLAGGYLLAWGRRRKAGPTT